MTPLALARKNLSDARSVSEKLRVEVAQGKKHLRLLSRIHSRGDHRLAEAGREQQSRLTALRDALARERAAQAELDRLLGESLLPDGAQDVAVLPATHPIVLLPVRLETRFAQDDHGAHLLKVRIFPDELMADTHERPLTIEEREAGMKFWRDGWLFEHEREAWRMLVATYEAPRAAWIARALTPLNLTSRPTGDPVFPETEIRAYSWTRAAEARVLPGRWVVIAYRGRREMHRAVGLRIQEPLTLTLSPAVEEDDEDNTVDVSGDGLRIEKELAWTINYEAAVEAGMAVTLPISAVEASRGFDRIIVMGVKSSLTAEEAGAQLSQLLESHHYDRGLAIVPQGTPTNNSAEAPSGYPFTDEDGAISFAVERGASLNGPGSNGTLLARALGISEDITSHCAGSNLREQPNAHAMNEALWPATWGYFLDQMMDPVLTDDAIRLARGHFAAHVRGRGSLPAFRTGATPYGALTVSSLSRWTASPESGPVEAQLAPLLKQLLPVWMEQVPRVPRVGATGNPDDDLVAVLGMDASTREVHARPTLGPQVQAQLFNAINLSATVWETRLRSIAQEVMARVGHPEWNPRLAGMSFASQAHRVRAPFITSLPLSETEPLQPFNYIRWIRTATVAQLRQEQFPPEAARPSALLYQLLRHAALGLYANIATKVGIKHQVLGRLDKNDPEMPGEVRGGHRATTVWDRLEMKIPHVTGNATLADFLVTDRNSEAGRDIRVFRAALAELEGLPTAELDRLFTETLDVCSHRLDAWITSLPAKRLEEMRQRQPLGCHLGAFGWVEDVRPDATRPGTEPASTGGYIHAPSATHAAAAAVLRSAYLTRSGQDGARYAVDLSSARVRAAMELLDAVRQGQPLGAVLGYRFERGLHEGHRPLRLDKYIDPFRRLHPLVADKGGDSNEAVDAIAARNVVDGLLLRKAWQDGAVAWGLNGLPASGNDRDAIEAELRRLDEAVDAVTDLLTSESVFQLVRGNTEKAASVLDSIGQGLRPPEPEIALQPRGGTSLTHRVAVVLGGEPLSADGWTAVPATPRSLVEPYLDAWAGSLLGNPANVRCRLSHLDAANQRIVRTVTLSELGLRPLDVLALAGNREAQPAASELDRRIASLAPDAASGVEIQFAADAGWDRAVIRTFPEVLEAARGINALLGGSRALEPKDLLPSSDIEDADSADLLTTEAEQRASLAGTTLTDTKNQLQAAMQSSPVGTAALRAGLRAAASLGVPDAFPLAQGSDSSAQDAFIAQARTVMAELNRRITALGSAAGAAEKVRAVLGRDFVFLPRFRCINPSELDLAIAHGPALVGDAAAVTKWMQQSSRVRTALASWRHLSLLTGALDGPPPSLHVAQLPHATNARWVGLAFPTEEERPPSGCLSLVLHRPATPPGSGPWVGLLLDEWNEIIPGRTEDTSIAFHYDDPGAEAAQAILIAVPPTDAAQWDQATLLDILNETLDLAKVRAVDGELLPLGQLLPAIYLASNPNKDTVSTDLRPFLQRALEATL